MRTINERDSMAAFACLRRAFRGIRELGACACNNVSERWISIQRVGAAAEDNVSSTMAAIAVVQAEVNLLLLRGLERFMQHIGC